jgi:hypothetical protein
MKKALFIFAILGLIAASYAQNKQTNIQIGTLKPKATDSGLIISLGVGRDYDERVELGFSGEIFTVKQTEEERINWYDPNTSTYVDTVVTNFESSIL